ncbi:MAG: hypothetical protein ACO3B3_00725 [Cyanobium sp.]
MTSTLLSLEAIAALAAERGLRLGLRAPRRLGIWSLQVGVARPQADGSIRLLGELKGWALPRPRGLHLDTLRVERGSGGAVAPLIWAASFAWALEVTPCRSARLLAIRDGERQHRRLVRYFQRLGFEPVRELAAAPADLPLRLLWGGSGLLMRGECSDGLARCGRMLAGGQPPPARAEDHGSGGHDTAGPA